MGCGLAMTGGHYNPTFKTYTSCANQVDCELGDFSGKHGKLGIGKSTDIETFRDTQASALYDSTQGSRGSKWIVGRSIVIHKANGERWACANIGVAGVGVNVAFAGDVSGTIELFQPSPSMATAVTVSLNGLEAGGNKWHVHDFPVSSSGSCADTGSHYDPMQSVPEYGDLSAKWGLLNGDTGDFTGTGQGYLLDTTLPLFGEYSSLGRSIVLHRNNGGERWVCATIPNRLKVRFPAVGGAPSGSMSFYQATVGGAVTITSSLRSLEGTAAGNKWHVHRFPTDAAGGTGDGGCGADVTAGHYNPTFKSGYTSCTDQSDCEVGDLSTKHGKLGIGKSTDMVSLTPTLPPTLTLTPTLPPNANPNPNPDP